MSPQGTLEWRTYDSRHMCGMNGQEINAYVVYAPTRIAAYRRRGDPFLDVVCVCVWEGGFTKNIASSLVHLEHTTFMQKMDVADQLRGVNSCQVRLHKWWHMLF
jgi:hypothetical protein